MTRARLLTLSAVVGVAVAVGLASAGRPDQPTGLARAAVPAVAPLVPTDPPRAQDPSPQIGPTPLIAGGRPILMDTIQPYVTAPDVAGGPDWAVRAWQRKNDGGKPIWCGQLGRLVDGKFVWVVPGNPVAGPIPDRETTETTVCAVKAPISDRLGIGTASLPDRDGNDPAAKIATTVMWGVVDRPVERASIQHQGQEYPVEIKHRVFLKVLRGTARATRSRLVVRDRDGGRREAIPPAMFDMQNPGHMDRVAQPAEVRPLERITVGTDGVTKGVFARDASRGRPACVTSPMPMVAGRPVMLDRRSGLVREPQLDCSPLPVEAGGQPSPIGGGWTSGDPTPAGTSRAASSERRRTQRRLQYGSGGSLVAVPPGTRFLEVQSPIGVKTVRVGPSRVTWVGWDGQPEAGRAMFPPFPGSPRWEQEIKTGHTPITFRALDSAGKQIGKPGYAGQVTYTREMVRNVRRSLAKQREAMREYRRQESAKAR